MKLHKEYSFIPLGSSDDAVAQPYFIRLYKEKSTFTLFGNGDSIDVVEEEIFDGILNDGLIQQFKKELGNGLFMTNSKRTYLTGCNFCISGITSKVIAEKLYEMAVAHLEKFKDSYAITRKCIQWSKAPDWAKCWVALPESKAVYSDQLARLDLKNDAWIFPKGSKIEHAQNMQYVGDWRKLIAVRGEDDYIKVLFRGRSLSNMNLKYASNIGPHAFLHLIDEQNNL